MASTRNKNTSDNYKIEQKRYLLNEQYTMDQNRVICDETYIPDFGVNPTRIPREQMAHNSIDIESKLFGINANNLVTPTPELQEQYINMPHLEFYERPELIMPTDLNVNHNNRPMRK
jgi:hypothetical protein|uniref:Uncharacterized protein n=1 Tax=viral metagenome TaxID=1070528 RepID=A0A6C0JD72_9ZZZZ